MQLDLEFRIVIYINWKALLHITNYNKTRGKRIIINYVGVVEPGKYAGLKMVIISHPVP
jgi:hypothetical protein